MDSTATLVDLIREVQAVATAHRKRVPQLLRQSFGLNFLPEQVLINLLQQAQSVERESELYQVPSLQLLHPVASNLTLQVANTYRYQFTCPQATFNLTPDNPQIPAWVGNDANQPGNYTITLEQPDYPGLADDFGDNIWQQATKSWQTLPDIQKINLALQSLDPANFRLSTPQTPHLQVWMSLQDLSLDLRAAITFLRLGEDDTSNTVRLRVIGEDYINVETRRQSPTEGNPPAALAQLSRLYRNYRYVNYLIRTVLTIHRLCQNLLNYWFTSISQPIACQLENYLNNSTLSQYPQRKA